MADWRLINVLVLGIGFMFIFSAFQTCSMVEQTVITDARDAPNSTFTGNGYTSLAIIYIFSSLFNWVAPAIVNFLTPKWSLVVSGFTYFLFIASFLYPMTWALYVGSVLVGIGAAVLWTAQGSFLTLNSDAETVGRNSGIFWALLQSSLLIGNLFSYFELRGATTISDSRRTVLFGVFSGACFLGVLSFVFLRKAPFTSSKEIQNVNISSSGIRTGPGEPNGTEVVNVMEDRPAGPVKALVQSFKLMATKNMLLLSVCFAYTGLELTFFSGVYGTSVSNTKILKDPDALIGICGMFIGAGEIIGGAAFGLLGKRTNRFGRDPIVLLGFLVHTVAFFLIFINIPDIAPIHKTEDVAYFYSVFPNEYVAVLCGFLLGFGDSTFNTQIYSILGFMYPDESAPAFALYKFMQSLAAAVAFFYSDVLMLKWQLLILQVMCVLGSFCFFIVEWGASHLHGPGMYTSID
ncbi:UNC93-like protein MFSD11 isoform X2 [Lingula anatina]|uniref:UNC93-like protein MFSD11 n=1 Tax=Lingula anatina TaxID=7574 RepID=A0A1S3INY5_LINAN|nr:UNC93-like protein MFSD11 isoform X2 [Lingula anatina]|eukprot:XP_013399249.1 UNC93-like protein MFSD11 isoform X2 [Lingula anatina]